MERQTLPKRLESLDALRGLDLFFLVAFGPLIRSLIRAADVPWLNSCAWLFKHQFWTGFSPWDLIMPLFLFMSGITIPFAYSRYKTNPDNEYAADNRCRLSGICSSLFIYFPAYPDYCLFCLIAALLGRYAIY